MSLITVVIVAMVASAITSVVTCMVMEKYFQHTHDNQVWDTQIVVPEKTPSQKLIEELERRARR